MAVTTQTLELLGGMRLHVARVLELTDRLLVDAWARAWTEVAAEWEAALTDLVAGSADGRWPSRRQIARARRVQQALEATAYAVEQVAASMGVIVTRQLGPLVADAVAWEQRLILSQLPVSHPRTAMLAGSLGTLDQRALDAIVRRTTASVTKDFAALPGFVRRSIQSTLVKGVAVGGHPYDVARDMLARLEGRFDLGRHRSLVIARTELVDAHRAAAQEADKPAAGVLTGWTWAATLDERTCIGCLSMHGRTFARTTPGPQGHQQCRCARLPMTKSLSDLGFDVQEPPSLLPDAKAWFDRLPRAQQLRIAGPGRLAAYRSGRVGWDDLAVRRRNAGWRDSWVPAPVKRLGVARGRAA